MTLEITRGPTFDRVGFGQLGKVGYEVFGNGIPGLALSKPEIDMGTRQLVYVELEHGAE